MEELNSYVQRAANELELIQNDGESNEEFRARVAAHVFAETEDPYEAAEVLTSDVKERNDLAMSFILLLGDIRKLEALVTGDTYPGINWIDFCLVASRNGFVLQDEQKYKERNSKDARDFSLWTNSEKGMILKAHSYSFTSEEGVPKRKASDSHLGFEVSSLNTQEPELRRAYWKSFEDQYTFGSETEFYLEEGRITPNGPGVRFILRDDEILAKRYSRLMSWDGLSRYLKKLENSQAQVNNPWKYTKDAGYCIFLGDNKMYEPIVSSSKDWKSLEKVMKEREVVPLPDEVKSILGV